MFEAFTGFWLLRETCGVSFPGLEPDMGGIARYTGFQHHEARPCSPASCPLSGSNANRPIPQRNRNSMSWRCGALQMALERRADEIQEKFGFNACSGTAHLTGKLASQDAAVAYGQFRLYRDMIQQIEDGPLLRR